MAFLPEKLSCPQKQARPHFPTHDVCPLIDENWEIAIGLHPSSVAGADDRLRSGSDNERLRQRAGRFHFSLRVHLQARMRNDRAFLGEAFDVFRFLREITQRNEKRKVRVAMACGAKHCIELALHVLPDPVAPWTNHHAAAHVRGLSQFRRANNLLVPFWKVFVSARRDGAFRHCRVQHGGELSVQGLKSPAGFSKWAIRDPR